MKKLREKFWRRFNGFFSDFKEILKKYLRRLKKILKKLFRTFFFGNSGFWKPKSLSYLCYWFFAMFSDWPWKNSGKFSEKCWRRSDKSNKNYLPGLRTLNIYPGCRHLVNFIKKILNIFDRIFLKFPIKFWKWPLDFR